MERVFVTGLGIVSAIGNDVLASLSQLKSSISGIGKAQHFESKYSENLNFGEVKLSNAALKERLNVTDQDGMSRTALLAMLAFQEAVFDADLPSELISDWKTGFISSSTVGGMSNTDALYSDANLQGKPTEYVGSYAGDEHTLRIVKKYGIRGFSATINTACSSAANAMMLGSRLIKSGRLKRVVVGGADALAKYTVNGFNALMILSQDPCKPFDQNRVGLTLGEGAGYLVLEAESVCENKKKYAEVIGYGNANDAFHPSATSDEAYGPTLAMKRALESSGLKADDIDYINAHGTGTPNNDITEQYAFTQVFEKVPPFNSTKSYTGHTLAAAGSVEAIFSILSLQHNTLFASLHCETPISDYGLQPINTCTPHSMQHVMTNSFGFGGNCTSLILSKV